MKVRTSASAAPVGGRRHVQGRHERPARWPSGSVGLPTRPHHQATERLLRMSRKTKASSKAMLNSANPTKMPPRTNTRNLRPVAAAVGHTGPLPCARWPGSRTGQESPRGGTQTNPHSAWLVRRRDSSGVVCSEGPRCAHAGPIARRVSTAAQRGRKAIAAPDLQGEQGGNSARQWQEGREGENAPMPRATAHQSWRSKRAPLGRRGRAGKSRD